MNNTIDESWKKKYSKETIEGINDFINKFLQKMSSYDNHNERNTTYFNYTDIVEMLKNVKNI